MEELYYVPSSKVNSKVADLVIDGNHIEIKGITYQRLSRKPRGRSIKRKLKGLETETSILIYQYMVLTYLIIGVAWACWLEYFTTKHLEGPYGKDWKGIERILNILLWPVSLGFFVYSLIVEISSKK